MNLTSIILAGVGLLAAYVVVCWLLAFLRNMAVDLGNRALRALAAWVRRRLEWRRFTAVHEVEFAGPEFQWPATGAGGSERSSW